MFTSFLIGAIFRLLYSFFDKIIDVFSDHLKQKRSIYNNKYLLENQIDVTTQIQIAKIQTDIADIRAEVGLAKDKEQHAKSGIKWIDACQLFTIITSYFWCIVIPLLIMFYRNPTQEYYEKIIIIIIGYWFSKKY